MEILQNELISFTFIAIIVVLLAFLTKKKEEQFEKMNQEFKDKEESKKDSN